MCDILFEKAMLKYTVDFRYDVLLCFKPSVATMKQADIFFIRGPMVFSVVSFLRVSPGHANQVESTFPCNLDDKINSYI